MTALALGFARMSGVATTLLATPLIFTAVGESLFGLLQIAQRVSIFGALLSLGSASYLKIVLLNASETTEPASQKNALAGALWVGLWALPALLLLATLTSWALSAGMGGSVSTWVAIGIVLIVPGVAQLTSLPQVVLYASGLGYRGSIVTAFVMFSLLVAGATATYATADLLPYALCSLAAAVACGAIVHRIAIRHVAWYSNVHADRRYASVSMRGGGKAMVASGAYLALQQVEYFAAGIAGGAELVASVVVSSIGVQVAELWMRMFINAAMPRLNARKSTNASTVVTLVSLVTLCYALAAAPVILLTPLVVGVWIPSAEVLPAYAIASIFLISFCRTIAQFMGMMLDQKGRFIKKSIYAIFLVVLPAIVMAFAVGWISVRDEYLLITLVPGIALYAIAMIRALERELCGRAASRSTWFVIGIPVIIAAALAGSGISVFPLVGATIVVAFILALSQAAFRRAALVMVRWGTAFLADVGRKR